LKVVRECVSTDDTTFLYAKRNKRLLDEILQDYGKLQTMLSEVQMENAELRSKNDKLLMQVAELQSKVAMQKDVKCEPQDHMDEEQCQAQPPYGTEDSEQQAKETDDKMMLVGNEPHLLVVNKVADELNILDDLNLTNILDVFFAKLDEPLPYTSGGPDSPSVPVSTASGKRKQPCGCA